MKKLIIILFLILVTRSYANEPPPVVTLTINKSKGDISYSLAKKHKDFPELKKVLDLIYKNLGDDVGYKVEFRGDFNLSELNQQLKLLKTTKLKKITLILYGKDNLIRVPVDLRELEVSTIVKEIKIEPQRTFK